MATPFHRRMSMGPSLFQCPITQDIFENPVILMGDGQTYEEESLKMWLADHNTSPTSGASLSSKEYCVNFALKGIIDDWMRNHASEKLKGGQNERLETYFRYDGPYKDLFDAEIIIGEDADVFRVVRGMFASLSPFLKEMMYGANRKKRRFEMPGISCIGFEQVLRMAYNMDPEIDTDNVMDILQASNFCQVKLLKDEALAYLSRNINIPKISQYVMAALAPDNDYGVDERLKNEFIALILNRPLDGSNVMTVFNAALSLQMLTPELEQKCCKLFVSHAEQVCESSAFVYTRPELLIELIENDFFCVKEETLWKRCVAWAKTQGELDSKDQGLLNLRMLNPTEETKETEESAPAVTATPGGPKDQMLGVMNNDDSKEKDPILIGGIVFPDQGHQYLAQVIPHIRFPAMAPDFFVDQASPLLPREMSDSVLFHHVLPSKECMFSARPRVDVSGSGVGSSFAVVASNVAIERAKNIPDPNTRAEWSRTSMTNAGGNQWFICDMIQSVLLQKCEWKNYYADDDTIKEVSLYMLSAEFEVGSGAWNEEHNEGDHWVKACDIHIQKTTDWQTHQFTIGDDKPPTSQYWKFEVTDLYGSNDRYACLDYLKLHCERKPWCSNFANLLPEEPDANAATA